MEIQEALSILKRHNYWRRGAEIEPTNPSNLGIAIDTLIDYVENL